MKDVTVICVANNYCFDPTSKHHIMRSLAKSNDVLWINWHASRRPNLNRRDLGSIKEKLLQIWQGPINVQDRLWVMTPFVVPLPSFAVARKLNRFLVMLQARRILRKMGPRRQMWTFTADVGDLAGAFSENILVYYCVDDFAAFSGFNENVTRRLDHDLCVRADIVVSSSRALYEAKLKLNPRTCYMTHGVQHRMFSKALDPGLPVPGELRAMPGPILGYYGLIEDWQDLDLIAALARRRPEWTFVLIGKVSADISQFSAIPNVHFLGQKPHSQLPSFCRGFDVALIPHKINRLTISMNPIKLREYLAAGLPVVSSPLPEVLSYQPHVRIASNPEQWIERIEECLRDRDPAKDCLRSSLMESEDWESKVQSLMCLIESGVAR